LKFFTAIDRYILRLVLVPMIGVFVLAASLLMLEKMLRLMEFVSTQGGPITIVFRMLLNMMPEYAGLAIPLGLMLGILFAFRKLATTSELDVLRAVGWSYTRLLRVPYIITLLLMGVNFAIVTITSSSTSSCAPARSAPRSRSASSPRSKTGSRCGSRRARTRAAG
jgi:lipopolysaccharide export system permease protein